MSLTLEQIDFLNEGTAILNYSPAKYYGYYVHRIIRDIPIWKETPDGINVDGDFNFYGKLINFAGFKEYEGLDIPVTFNKIFGNFTVDCANITTTKGIPNYIERNLTLLHCFKIVGSIKLPRYIGGNLEIYDCPEITCAEKLPEVIGGNIRIERCSEEFKESWEQEKLKRL